MQKVKITYFGHFSCSFSVVNNISQGFNDIFDQEFITFYYKSSIYNLLDNHHYLLLGHSSVLTCIARLPQVSDGVTHTGVLVGAALQLRLLLLLLGEILLRRRSGRRKAVGVDVVAAAAAPAAGVAAAAANERSVLGGIRVGSEDDNKNVLLVRITHTVRQVFRIRPFYVPKSKENKERQY